MIFRSIMLGLSFCTIAHLGVAQLQRHGQFVKRTKQQSQRNYQSAMLWRAACTGDIVKAQTLIEAGADVNSSDKRGRTALMFASSLGYTAVVKQLLDAGARVNQQDRDGFTALMFATAPLYLPTQDEFYNFWGQSPKYEPTQNYLLRLAHDLGRKCDVRKKEGVRAACHDVVVLLLEAGANPDNTYAITPLLMASCWGDEKMVRQLLQVEARVDAGDKVGLNPLIPAVKLGNRVIVKLLLGAGVRVDISCQGSTALTYAQKFGHTDIVDLLRAMGAN